ncbi:MAG: ATP-binding protein, partial [Gaiellaceae bacterium]
DAMVAAALIDRLVHHATMITLKDKSYRLRQRGLDVTPQPGGALIDCANRCTFRLRLTQSYPVDFPMPAAAFPDDAAGAGCEIAFTPMEISSRVV